MGTGKSFSAGRSPALLSRPWRPFLWTLGILSVAYLPLFLGQIIFFRDVAHWTFPARAFLRQSLLGGELPQWNPYQALGFPVFADPLYGIFYPPNWLFLLVGRGWVATLLNWQCFLHMAWGALGACFLVRRLRASATATGIAGLAWALSGYVTSQWSSGLLLFADAWVPWAAVGHLALLDGLRAGGAAWRRGMLKAALPTVFACLLGELFIAMIGAGFGVLFAWLVHAVERREDPSLPRPRHTWAASTLAAVVLGFGVGGVVILPAATLLGSTERAVSLSRGLAEVCSLHPLRMIELITPQSMGDPYGLFPAAPIIGEPRLDGLPLSYSMYLGASVVALALAAFGRGRRLAVGIGTVALLALLLAFGRYTPIHGVFRRVMLPLSYMRYPEKYAIVFVTLVAVLAASGVDRILSDARQPWRRTGAILVVMLGFAVVAVTALPAAWMPFALHGALMGTVALGGVFAVEVLAARRSRLAAPLLVLLVAFDLALAAWPLQTFGPRQLADNPPRAASEILRSRPPGSPPPRIYRANRIGDTVNRLVPTTSNAATELKLRETLITNTANVWGIATLPGYDAAIPALVDEVWSRGLENGRDALRLLGADYAILPVATPDAPADDRPGFSPVLDPLPGARMYKVTDTLPRVYWASHAEVMPDGQALARLFEPDVVAGASVWLAPESRLAPLSDRPGRAGACKVESYGNQRIVATCSGSQQGIVVFVEQYDRGWRATVDGKPAQLARANLIMRALPLPPGDHRIVLEYRTPGLLPGLVASLVSLLVLVLLVLLPWEKVRPVAHVVEAQS